MVLTPVARIGLNTDVHKTVIHLTMIDQQGEEIGFLLPMEVARPPAEGLPVRLAEIDRATKALKTLGINKATNRHPAIGLCALPCQILS